MQTRAHLTCKQQLTSKRFYCILITVCMLLVDGRPFFTLPHPPMNSILFICLTFTMHYFINLYRHLMDNQIVSIDRGAFSDLKELDRL